MRDVEAMKKTLRRAVPAVMIAIAASAWGGAASAGEVVQGGGFESGAFDAAWVHGAAGTTGGSNPAWADHRVVLDLPYSGSWSALLGFKYTQQVRNRYGFMYQNVAIPTNISRATLYFRFRQQGYDGLSYDPFQMSIRRTNGSLLATVVDFSFSEWNDQFKDSGWIEDNGDGTPGYDMTGFSGQTVRLDFRQYNTYDDLYETWVFVDDVSLVYRRFVDLAVDADGNDVFGDVGSGAGGSSSSSGVAGETVSYLLDIENEGLDVDSYTVSVSPPAGWTVRIRYGGTVYSLPWTTPSIAPGATIAAEVLVTAPAGASLGMYTTILNAVSPAHGNRYDSVTLGTHVTAGGFLADLVIDSNGFGVIDPDGGGGVSYRSAPPDTTIEYLLDVYNTGVLRDSFTVWSAPAAPLTAVMLDGGVPQGSPFTTAGIEPGQYRRYTLRVTIPVSLIGGDYITYVYARSVRDFLKQDGVRAITRVLAPKLDLVIAGSGDGIYDPTGAGLGGTSTIAGQRGNTVYFPIIVENEGGVADSFTLDWAGPGTGWSAAIIESGTSYPFPWTTPAMEAFGSRSYTLAVTIPGNAAFNTYVSILEAVSLTSGSVSESVTASVTVASGNETDLIIDGNGADAYGGIGTGLGGSSEAYAAPGDTVRFTVRIENETGANSFEVQWNVPAGWTVLLDGAAPPLGGVPDGTYTLEAHIPLTAPKGNYDIIVDAKKTGKPYFVDSARGRIFVRPPHRVDALIDGNGDGIYSAPGTGAGGLSSQSTISGRTVGFTLELQNEGAEAEQYLISWNAIPGWTATIAGQPSPYATASIPAGGSSFFAFSVTIPVSAAAATYDYVIDAVSVAFPSSSESVTARVTINPPPRVDLIIDGRGAGVTGPAGSGQGGRAMTFGAPGADITAVLQVVNSGGFPDSFRIDWAEPSGWPAGSILLDDGTGDRLSPFVTALIYPGDTLTYTVKVAVPPSAGLRSTLIINGVALSRDLEDSVLLEIITAAFVTGRVFVDADHDGVFDAGEAPLGSVSIRLTDPSAPLSDLTGADGVYLFEAPSGVPRTVMETTPSGMISLSPDTVSAGTPAAGDTVVIDFADVYASAIAPPGSFSGPAGSWVDIPHAITAGTSGQAAVIAVLPAGWADVWYRDVNGDGLFDAGDRILASADLALDPSVPGQDVVPVIVRILIPAGTGPGTVGSCMITLEQTLSGTSIVTTSQVNDLVTVLAGGSGTLRLVKAVDLVQARPGDEMTYTITFTNPGIEDVVEIEIIDPVSAAVDLVAGAFGPGADIAWTTVSGTTYLTADPLDADEALFDAGTGTLRVILSRQAPFALGSGESGSIEYRVRIR